MIDRSVSPKYFEKIYADNVDPWGYTTSSYEEHKYTATLAALPRARFKCAFEPGCSIGVLTRLLAKRCQSLLAIDVSDASLARAEERCAAMRTVRFQRMRVPFEWPNRTFDLVVLSEVLYYLSDADARALARKTIRCLGARGIVLLVHWLGETGTRRSGDQAARRFIRQAPRLRIVARKRTSRYRLDVFAR
jgi:SAM-dependent methyltransferase